MMIQLRRATSAFILAFAAMLATPAFAAFDIAYYDQGMRVTGAYGFGPGGYVYLVSQGENNTSIMRRIAPDGSIDWETSFAGNSLYGSVVGANASRACVALLQGADESATNFTLIVQCFAADDGATVWRADPVATDARFQRPLLYLGATNAVSVVYGIPGETGTVRMARRGADGGDEGTVALPATNYSEEAAFSNDGSVLVYDFLANPAATRIVGRDGVVKGSYAVSQFPLLHSYDTIAPDGSVLLIGPQRLATIGDRTLAIKLSPTGTEIWRRVLREEQFVPFPVVFGDGAAFFSIAHEATPADEFSDVGPPYASIALDYTTGAVRWDVNVPVARHAFFTGNVSADGDKLVLVHTLLNSKVRVQTRDTATGAIVTDTEYECGARSCSKLLTALDAAGTLRIIGLINTNNTHAVFAQSDVTDTPLNVIVDNFGLKGGWSTGTNGQGLTVDIGANGSGGTTLFAPWFTMAYRSSGESQTTTIADLRWYTLQADLPDELVRSLPVIIYETFGGQFGVPGAASTVRVGEGTISFTSCDEGSLVYSFDEDRNSGAQGVVGLTRLTPRTHACTIVAANGAISLEEVDSSQEGAGGFSLDFSGTWSQVGSSGQGLELMVRPGEVIVGAWFTFDGTLANYERQHWFTLDGSLATATDATVTTTLYQTIGGTFDNRPSNSTTAVGTATIRFLNCRSAELSYAFGPNAGAHANLTGTLQLEHLSGCLGQ